MPLIFIEQLKAEAPWNKQINKEIVKDDEKN